jgi:hypothetical protein
MTTYASGEGLEPMDDYGDAAQILDDVRDFLARFVAFPSDDALTAATLWAAHTHALEAFECTPRIAFLSPEPGSGKTRALEILELLVVRPLLTVNVTPAYLFRKVADEAGPPTVLYDEIDTVFGPKAKDNEDIRGMLNAGYRRGATAGRCVIRGKTVDVEELPAFAAVALAGLDDLPDTIASRCVIVRMRRRAPNEPVEAYRRRVHADDGQKLRDRLSDWAGLHWDSLADVWPQLPPGIEDRDADVWEPLLAVADAAGSHWPETARVAAVALVAAARDKEGGFGVKLLADLRKVFGSAERLSTDDILTKLRALEESPWSDLRGKPLDARDLARRLSKYEVKSKQLRFGDKNVRGYEATDLGDAWSRYLPAADDEDKEADDEDKEADDEDKPAADDEDKPAADDEDKEDVTSSIPPGGMREEGDDRSPSLPPRDATSATAATEPTSPSPHTPTNKSGTGSFTWPTGPGRCSGCGYHIETQGHGAGCEAA